VSRRAAIAVAVVGLLASMLSIRGLVDRAVQSAACIERARFELISCIAPPDVLTWTVATAVSLAIAVGLGMAIGLPARLRSRRRLA
jgi:hypothetical protein